MSMYLANLTTTNQPYRDELDELDSLDSLTAEQKTRRTWLSDTIEAAIKDGEEYKAAFARSQKVKSGFDRLPDELSPARARNDVPQLAAETQTKAGTWFDHLVETKGFKHAVRDNGIFRERVPIDSLYTFETKAPFAVTNPAALTGPMEVINRYTERNRHPVLDLVPTVVDERFSIPYLPITFTNAADEVAWGALKPESTNAGTVAFLQMVTIAHWKEVIRQQLHYLPGLRSDVEAEMREGVLETLEKRIINGLGTGGEMAGLLTIITQAAAGADLALQIFDAIGTVETNRGIVDAILVHPKDYTKLLVYEWGTNVYNPIAAGGLFANYRVVKSPDIAEGKAIVGDWAMATKLHIGDALSVSSTEAVKYTQNILTFRGEMDAVLQLKRPWLMVKCTAAMPLPPPPAARSSERSK